jgi:putative spermidine/putrescine transport system permease protein
MDWRISLKRLAPILPALPAILVMLGLFAGGVGVAVGQSLGMLSPIGEAGPTVRHYLALRGDREVWQSLRLTFGLAGVATFLAAWGGLGLALGLRRLARQSRLVNLLVQIPLAIPHLTMAVFLINLVSPGGLVARLFYHWGWISGPGQFPVLVNDGFGIGIILAYLLKEIPFVTVMLLTLLVRLGDEYEEVARTLGATGWQRLRYVTLPLLAPAALSSSLLVMAFIVGAYETPYLLGRAWPAMLAVVARRRYLDVDLGQRPGGIAVAVLLSLFTALLLWLYLRVMERWQGRAGERTLLF